MAFENPGIMVPDIAGARRRGVEAANQNALVRMQMQQEAEKAERDTAFRNTLIKAMGLSRQDPSSAVVNSLVAGAPQPPAANSLLSPPEAPIGGDVVNSLLAIDPERTQVLLGQQAEIRQAQHSERAQSAREAIGRMQAVLTSSKPSLMLEWMSRMPDGADLIEHLTAQGIVNPDDGIDDDEAKRLAEMAIMSLTPIAGLDQPEGLFAKIDPSEYSPESVADFQRSGDYSALRPADSDEESLGDRSTIGELLADRGSWEEAGNAEAVAAIDAAIEKELDAGGEIDFGSVMSFRREADANSMMFLEQQRGAQGVLAAANDPSPAGDLALVFGTMKVLDPGSIVREGEVQLTEGAGSLAQRVAASFKSVWSGERLTEGQRRDFIQMARSQFQGALDQQQRLVADAEDFAEKYNIDPEMMIPEYIRPAEIDWSSALGERGRAGPAIDRAVGRLFDGGAEEPARAPVELGGVTVEFID